VVVLVSLLCLLVGGLIGATVGVVMSRRAFARMATLDGVLNGPDGLASPAGSTADLVTGRAVQQLLAPAVLDAIDVGVVVVDRDEFVRYANRAATDIRMVSDDRLSSPTLTSLVRMVFDECRAEQTPIEVPRGVAGTDALTFMVYAMPLGNTAESVQSAGSVARASTDLAGQRPTGVLLRFTDITETLRLERVRRDFVANVSHELKTPVGALTLLAEAVQDASDDPAAVQRFSRRMHHEGARLGRLVQELIELSRLQGAEPLPGRDLVDVDRLISEAVDRNRLLAEQSGISVVERVDGDLLVRGNETQLSTAVANLVDNAIAYSPERTRVTVSARSVIAEDGSCWVEITVTDQGIGIAEQDLDRVFERFFRVDPARSRATGGTGLGLAIVKHVASNHGGSVSVWSVVGSGSSFTLKLPAAQSVAIERTPA
jgi:two-component system sensor histidine kinase SenX3